MVVGGSDRVVVAFRGEGAGVDDLAWGQLDMWRVMVARNSWLPLGGIKPLPAGTTVDEMADELRYLMSRTSRCAPGCA